MEGKMRMVPQRTIAETLRIGGGVIMALAISCLMGGAAAAQGAPSLGLKSGAKILIVTNRAKNDPGLAQSTKVFSSRVSRQITYAIVTQSGPRRVPEEEIPVEELNNLALAEFFSSPGPRGPG